MTKDTLEATFQSVRRYIKSSDKNSPDRSRQISIARQEFVSLASCQLEEWFNKRLRQE